MQIKNRMCTLVSVGGAEGGRFYVVIYGQNYTSCFLSEAKHVVIISLVIYLTKTKLTCSVSKSPSLLFKKVSKYQPSAAT